MSQVDESLTLPDEKMKWGQWLHALIEERLTYSEASPLILLTHTDDGVLWGKLIGATLTLSCDEFDQLSSEWQQRVPQLNIALQQKTLQQLRLFNESGELLIWRDGNQFKYRILKNNNQKTDYIEQTYHLWGDRVVAAIDNFTLLQEGERGLWHAPPTIEMNTNKAQLIVRHSVKYDELGQAYISMSHLCALKWLEQGEQTDETR